MCLTSSAVFSVPFPIDCKGYICEKTKSALDELKSFGQNIHLVLNVHRKNCSLEKKKEKYGTEKIKIRLYNDQLQGNQPKKDGNLKIFLRFPGWPQDKMGLQV